MKPRSLLIGATVPLRPWTSTAVERTRRRPSTRPRSLRAGASRMANRKRAGVEVLSIKEGNPRNLGGGGRSSSRLSLLW